MSHHDHDPQRADVLDRLRAVGRRQSTAMVLFHGNVAARLGLGPTDVKVLDLVARHRTLTPKELGALTGLAPASVTGVLDRLEAKRFIRREPSPDDGRRVHVVHSPEHTAVVGELIGTLMAGLAEVHDRYSIEQLDLILGFIEATTQVQEDAARALTEDG